MLKKTLNALVAACVTAAPVSALHAENRNGQLLINQEISKSQTRSLLLKGEETLYGKHFPSDFHIHAFNHNEGNKPDVVVKGDQKKIEDVFNDGNYRHVLSHITRRTREGGYKCSFHSFSEHVGYESVNQPAMFSKINRLNNSIAASTDGIELNSRINELIKKIKFDGKKNNAKKNLRLSIPDRIWTNRDSKFSVFVNKTVEELESNLDSIMASDEYKGKLFINDDFKEAVIDDWYRSHLVDDECSYFAVGLEFTPQDIPKAKAASGTSKKKAKRKKSGHVLMLFADKPKNQKTSLASLYNSLPDLVPDRLQGNSNQDTLLAFAHPYNPSQTALSEILQEGLGKAATINIFKTEVMQKAYNINEKNSSKLSKRYVGVEFPRLAKKQLVQGTCQ